MALDLLIERAVAPLRVSNDDVARFDADMAMVAGAAPWTGSGAGALAAGTAGIEPLRPEQARRLLAVLWQACAAARRGAARRAPVELAKRRAASGSGAAMPAPPFGELGELVRQGRARLRLSVFQLAHRLHVHRDYLSGLEAGERSPLALGAEGACRLVALLELSPRQVASALEQAMGVSLAGGQPSAPAPMARIRRGLPHAKRRRVLEGTPATGSPSPAEEAEARAWQQMIAAVAALPEPATDGGSAG